MIDQFITITQEIIHEDGFADYLPTLLLPQTDELVVLESELDGDNHEAIVHDWLSERVSDGQDFLVAFKVDSEHFKVIGRIDHQHLERVCRVDEA